MKHNPFDNSNKAFNVDEVQTLSCQLQSKNNETVDFKQLAIGRVFTEYSKKIMLSRASRIRVQGDRLFSNTARVCYTTAIIGPP
jgi:hypothetical protein